MERKDITKLVLGAFAVAGSLYSCAPAPICLSYDGATHHYRSTSSKEYTTPLLKKGKKDLGNKNKNEAYREFTEKGGSKKKVKLVKYRRGKN